MNTNKHNKAQAILGAFYGQALGDAMGMPSELWPRRRVKSYFGWIDTLLPGPPENCAACYFKAAQFTDDTAMALALADAIISHQGQINVQQIADNILAWANHFDAFNRNILGPTSKLALTSLKQEIPIEQLENKGITNGAAMRIMPIGCLMPTHSLSDFIHTVALASSVTHKSDIAIAGAAVIAWAISQAINGLSWSTICEQLPMVANHAQGMGHQTTSPSLALRIELALNATEKLGDIDQQLQYIYDLIGSGTSTIESVASAIAMVQLAKTDANRCAVICANLGGDTDTIGAMATAICGALNGSDHIHQPWRQAIDEMNTASLPWYAQQFYQLRLQQEAQL